MLFLELLLSKCLVLMIKVKTCLCEISVNLTKQQDLPMKVRHKS